MTAKRDHIPGSGGARLNAVRLLGALAKGAPTPAPVSMKQVQV